MVKCKMSKARVWWRTTIYKPGDQYQYTSGTVINSHWNNEGYQMIDDADNYFEAEIPEFVLSVPRVIREFYHILYFCNGYLCWIHIYH